MPPTNLPLLAVVVVATDEDLVPAAAAAVVGRREVLVVFHYSQPRPLRSWSPRPFSTFYNCKFDSIGF